MSKPIEPHDLPPGRWVAVEAGAYSDADGRDVMMMRSEAEPSKIVVVLQPKGPSPDGRIRLGEVRDGEVESRLYAWTSKQSAVGPEAIANMRVETGIRPLPTEASGGRALALAIDG